MTVRDQGHYSTFALDVHHASGAVKDPILERHVRQCAECRAYLEKLDALGSIPAQAWAPPGYPAKRAFAPKTSKWIASLASAAVLVLGVVMWTSRERGGAGTYVGVK